MSPSGRRESLQENKVPEVPLPLLRRCPSLKNIYFEATASPTFCCNSDNVTEGEEERARGRGTERPSRNVTRPPPSLDGRAGRGQREERVTHKRTHAMQCARPPGQDRSAPKKRPWNKLM